MAARSTEEFFSDDELDTLPANALDELEERALQSTQHKVVSDRPHEASRQLSGLYQHHAQVMQVSVPPGHLDSPSSDYGFDDEDVIDLDNQAVALDQNFTIVRNDPGAEQVEPVPPNWPQVGGQQVRALGPSYRLVDRSTGNRTHVELPGRRDRYQVNQSDASSSRGISGPDAKRHHDEAGNLQARIQELEQELAELKRSAEEARATALSKAGEIAIVRANHDKAITEYEKRLALMQKAHAEEVARQRAELEISKKDREKVETTNRFLEHELKQEGERSKQIQRAQKNEAVNLARLGAHYSPLGTPRKQRTLPVGDGFDDDEIVMLSPSKNRPRSKPPTPRAAGKRKRAAIENSPGQLLELNQPSESFGAEASKPFDSGIDPELLSRLGLDDDKFQVVQRILNHHPWHGHERTFETFTKHALPSNSEKRISSMVYDGMLPLNVSKDAEQYLIGFCQVMLFVWELCLKNRHFPPLYLVIDLLHFTITLQPVNMNSDFVDRLLSVAVPTADLVAIPRASTKTSVSASKPTDPLDLEQDIDVFEILAVLHTAALGCVGSPEVITRFWKKMEFDFILVMLNKGQPLADIRSMLELLGTSTLPDTFGAILESPDRQGRHETDILDRLTTLLFETPTSPKDEPPYSFADVAKLRCSILSLFGALIATSHGGLALATNKTAIGRLIRFLHLAVASLYSLQASVDREPTVMAINVTVRILYHELTKFAEVVDVRAKLAAVPGAAHMHLVALARIAFCEGWALDEGIEEEVIEAAHLMLDEFLSPEEGEALMEAFGGFKNKGKGKEAETSEAQDDRQDPMDEDTEE